MTPDLLRSRLTPLQSCRIEVAQWRGIYRTAVVGLSSSRRYSRPTSAGGASYMNLYISLVSARRTSHVRGRGNKEESLFWHLEKNKNENNPCFRRIGQSRHRVHGEKTARSWVLARRRVWPRNTEGGGNHAIRMQTAVAAGIPQLRSTKKVLIGVCPYGAVGITSWRTPIWAHAPPRRHPPAVTNRQATSRWHQSEGIAWFIFVATHVDPRSRAPICQRAPA